MVVSGEGSGWGLEGVVVGAQRAGRREMGGSGECSSRCLRSFYSGSGGVGVFSEFIRHFFGRRNRSGNNYTRYWAEKKREEEVLSWGVGDWREMGKVRESGVGDGGGGVAWVSGGVETWRRREEGVEGGVVWGVALKVLVWKVQEGLEWRCGGWGVEWGAGGGLILRYFFEREKACLVGWGGC